MMGNIQFLIFFGFSWTIAGQSSAESYIDQYAEIAIEEMQRTGIPASIKLAQGLLESSIGASPLCTEANNHFGIKCGNKWTGKEMYREDDDYGINDVLTKSCFRVFDSGYDSYVAHSEFIMNPAKEFRYGFLFSIPTDDYENWARGLQSAGYATDPEYADKLINLINRYQLYEHDYATMFTVLVDTNVSDEPPIYNRINFADRPDKLVDQLTRKVIHNSHQTMAGETIQSIAQQYNIEPQKLDRSNQWGNSKPLPIGTELTWNSYLP